MRSEYEAASRIADRTVSRGRLDTFHCCQYSVTSV
jgi:hypothetical protein